jgi:hypothetical protein
VLAGGYYPPIKEIFPINSIRSHLEERQLEVKKNQILLLKVLALWPNVPKFDLASLPIKINGTKPSRSFPNTPFRCLFWCGDSPTLLPPSIRCVEFEVSEEIGVFACVRCGTNTG